MVPGSLIVGALRSRTSEKAFVSAVLGEAGFSLTKATCQYPNLVDASAAVKKKEEEERKKRKDAGNYQV